MEFFVCAHATKCATKECPGGGIGRRAGLKILYAAMHVRVQVPPGAHFNARSVERAYFFIPTLLIEVLQFFVNYLSFIAIML